MAAGSIGQAKVFDYEEFRKRRRPWLDFLEAILNRAEDEPAPDWAGLFEATKALAASREDFEPTLRLGYTLLRDLAQIAVHGSGFPVVNLDLAPRLSVWARKLGTQGIDHLKTGLDQAYRLRTRNVNQQLGLEVLAADVFAGSAASPARTK